MIMSHSYLKYKSNFVGLGATLHGNPLGSNISLSIQVTFSFHVKFIFYCIILILTYETQQIIHTRGRNYREVLTVV